MLLLVIYSCAWPLAAGDAPPSPPGSIETLPPTELLPNPALPFEEIPPAQVGAIVPVEGQAQRINLETTWRLAGVQNPTINIARQVVYEAEAIQRKARLVWFPNINTGGMLHTHVGNLLASGGEVRNLTEQSLYFGGGARTVAAESNSIPAVQLITQLSDALFNPLAARQETIARGFDARATNNDILLDATLAYLELLTAEAQWEALRLSHSDVQKLVEMPKRARGDWQTPIAWRPKASWSSPICKPPKDGWRLLPPPWPDCSNSIQPCGCERRVQSCKPSTWSTYSSHSPTFCSSRCAAARNWPA
jgi:hypothetical protein